MGGHGRVGEKAERVRCQWPGCRAWVKSGRGMSIHRSIEHGDKSKRFRRRVRGRWVYDMPRGVA
jgi:hypothetical protein